MRTTSVAFLLALAVSGCGVEGPVPQEAKDTPTSAASPAAALPSPTASSVVTTPVQKPGAAPSAVVAATAREGTVQSPPEVRQGVANERTK
jgi:hypothetical protein